MEQMTFLVLPEASSLGSFQAYDTLELTAGKAKTFVNKVMRIRHSPGQVPALVDVPGDRDRPLRYWVELQNLRRRRDEGIYIDSELLSARRSLKAELTGLDASLAALADKRTDAMHSSEIIRIDEEHGAVQKHCDAVRTALENTQARIDNAVREWHMLEKEIGAVEYSLHAFVATALGDRKQETTDLEKAVADCDDAVLDYVSAERAAILARPNVRLQYWNRAKAALEVLNHAIATERNERESKQQDDALPF
jgi:chromosome segregation ATPase